MDFSTDVGREEFISECRFAKLVDTFHGPALLIAGNVIQVNGSSSHFAELIVEALRRFTTTRDDGAHSMQGSTIYPSQHHF